MSAIVVKVAYDDEARVWFVASSDIAGLNLEAPSIEAMREKLPGAILDLIEVSGKPAPYGSPIELFAHTSLRLPPSAAA